MSGFANDNETYWSQQQGDPQRMQNPYYNPEADYSNLQSQQLATVVKIEDKTNFQSFSEEQKYAGQSSQFQYPEMFTPMPQTYAEEGNDNEFDEPPLLEELEIYPDRILEKTIAVLRPFRSECLTDDAEFLAKQTDLAGPVAFCLLLACCLFISGNKAPFGYIYVLSVISCFLMYVLLSLMTNSTGIFTLSSVASILGYCLLPIVGLSIIGVFSTLHGNFGIILAILVISWSSISASRLFCAMSKDYEQRPLIAYPCALVYGVFALLVVF